MPIRVLTWNLFHARDGHPEARATWRSTLTGRPETAGGHAHLNRKHTAEMAAVIARLAPDVAALQEVPTAAIAQLAARTGMAAAWVVTGPLLGPRRVRDRWAAANPDLWRTHEGNANVLLVGRGLRPVPGSLCRVRLNPWRTIASTGRRLRVPARELAHWAGEHRALVAARVATPDGRRLTVGSLHCHNTYVDGIVAGEAAAAAAAMRRLAGDGPALLAGDLNVHPGHPAHAGLMDAGWADAGAPRGIDRIAHRGMRVLKAPRALRPDAHEIRVAHRGRWWRVRLSDHAPVLGIYEPAPDGRGARAGG